jgi:hypothetical protein
VSTPFLVRVMGQLRRLKCQAAWYQQRAEVPSRNVTNCLRRLQERAEGRFDESGHYIENKDKDDANDAWLASEEGAPHGLTIWLATPGAWGVAWPPRMSAQPTPTT